jgi:hypothetical protein
MRLPDFTKLLAVAILNMADDEGFFNADELVVRGQLFPTDDSVKVHGGLTELSNIEYLTVREHSKHGKIGRIEGFLEHQKINRPTPSKLKTLFQESSIITESKEITESSLNPHGKLTAGTGNREQGKEQGTGKYSLSDQRSNGEQKSKPKSKLKSFGQGFDDWWQLIRPYKHKNDQRAEVGEGYQKCLKAGVSPEDLTEYADLLIAGRKREGDFFGAFKKKLKPESVVDELEASRNGSVQFEPEAIHNTKKPFSQMSFDEKIKYNMGKLDLEKYGNSEAPQQADKQTAEIMQ